MEYLKKPKFKPEFKIIKDKHGKNHIPAVRQNHSNGDATMHVPTIGLKGILN